MLSTYWGPILITSHSKMELYSQKSRWKLYLAIAGVAIVVASLIYTNYLTAQLAEEERKKVEIYTQAINEQMREVDPECTNCCEFTIYNTITTRNTTIPVILVNDDEFIVDALNFPSNEPEYLEQQLARIKKDGNPPVENERQNIAVYYKESTILTQLRYFPLVQLMLIAAFILFGYLSFSSARRAEQNRVWVGMAKETAHQLGTPISGIVAWIEHLKMLREEDDEVHEVLGELRNDVSRLELIADRFSKIGSAPKLQTVNIYEELDKCRNYMQRRAPRNVIFDFPGPAEGRLLVSINSHLFDWVVENLLRNALDAMGRSGSISADIYAEDGEVIIDITDTGKGIPVSKFKTVFQPGFTTKKRGWGLGLSLAKRIIEEYHSGRIFVKRSDEGVGTTFTIKLPQKKDDGQELVRTGEAQGQLT